MPPGHMFVPCQKRLILAFLPKAINLCAYVTRFGLNWSLRRVVGGQLLDLDVFLDSLSLELGLFVHLCCQPTFTADLPCVLHFLAFEMVERLSSDCEFLAK